MNGSDAFEYNGLDPLQFAQKFVRGKGGLYSQHCIQVVFLFDRADRVRVIKVRQGGDPCCGKLADFGYGA
jgi:hypothetical protein